tara:strand:- start:4100 stop:5302 length:1203 start_codon:yes stop_codon:yes gene_type:complete
MKADKDFKTLIQARFLVEVSGVEHFENYLDRAFPPSKTTKVTPSHKEVRLFYQVVEELHDQIKDLIGLDNLVAASSILTPLIRKSFYFKNRFVDIPDAFTKTHLHLVEILNTIHDIIEAPSLKLQNAKNVITLLKLSYVELLHFKEKKLILNLLKSNSNHRMVLLALKEQVSPSYNKAYRQFLSALSFICSKNRQKDTLDIGNIFVEIFSWQQKGYDYLDELFDIGKKHFLPSRFVEKLLTLSPKNDIQKALQIELALVSIEKNRSSTIFKWVYKNHPLIWQESREQITDRLKNGKDHHTLIKILIHENNVLALFDYLQSICDINIYHRYLTNLLQLSKSQTLKIYSFWASEYLSNHFGKTALDEFDRHMRKVAVIDIKLRNEIDKYVLKNFGERPSINM